MLTTHFMCAYKMYTFHRRRLWKLFSYFLAVSLRIKIAAISGL